MNFNLKSLAPESRLAERLARCFIFLLVLSLVVEPVFLYAQTRRSRDTRSEDEKPDRRRKGSGFSSEAVKQRESLSDTPGAQTDVGSISKAAYDAVIRSGKYVVGPGDIFIVVVDKDSENGPEIQDIAIGAEGKLVIPYIGAIPLGGLSLAQTRIAIDEAISKRFKHLDISVTLSKLKTFPVNVTGEVQYPGAYNINGVEQVSEIILKAGGLLEEPDGHASQRNIAIKRILEDGQLVDTENNADLLLWNLTGEIRSNPFILYGDQIFVPMVGDSISISGAVQRPKSFEFAPGDHVADLLRLGGVLRNSHADLLRLSADGQPGKRFIIDIAMALEGHAEFNFALRAGDKIFVDGEELRVTVSGEVRFPGAYPIANGLTLKELILRAELKPTASLEQAAVIREIKHEEENGAQDEEDVVLTQLLNIPRSQRTDAEQAIVTMKTQEAPGRLPIDFVALFDRGDERHNVILRGGDIVQIPRFVPSVRVLGSVIAPANIPYDSTFVVSDYINRAGGFSVRAEKEGVVLVQGGTNNPVKASEVRRIDPGDAIYVPEKQVTPGQGYRLFRETLAVAGSIASLILTISVIR